MRVIQHIAVESHTAEDAAQLVASSLAEIQKERGIWFKSFDVPESEPLVATAGLVDQLNAMRFEKLGSLMYNIDFNAIKAVIQQFADRGSEIQKNETFNKDLQERFLPQVDDFTEVLNIAALRWCSSDTFVDLASRTPDASIIKDRIENDPSKQFFVKVHISF